MMMSTTINKKLPTKEELIEQALKYDKKGKGGYLTTPSVAFSKGLRLGLSLCLPYLQDSFRTKVNKLIK